MSKLIFDNDFWNLSAQYANRISELLSKANPSKKDRVAELLARFHKRIFDGQHILRTLQLHHTGEWHFEGGMILRGMYDIYLQAAWMMQNVSAREERAQLYIDFHAIEHYKWLREVEKGKTPFHKKLASSTQRSISESEIRRRYQEVLPKFIKKRNENNEPRKTWYPGHIRSLANQCGLENEYGLLIVQLHALTHSSPWAIFSGNPIDVAHLTTYGWRIVFRTLGLLVDRTKTALDEELRELISYSQKDFFGDSPETTS